MANDRPHTNSRRNIYLLLALLILASLPFKLVAAQNMPFDIDFVPVLSRILDYRLPPVGTLSSVAAYNMPMLEWLHLPAFYLTDRADTAILLTMLSFNILSTIAVFCVGDAMVNARVGLIAALIFSFSEVGMSSAYTAWAQLLLPGFYAMTVFFLWEWRRQEKGVYLAVAGMIATAAFMTHFSAILLFPAMLAFAILSGARWQWRGLLMGGIGAVLLLLPYLRFDAQRDFVNLRAFLQQENRVPADVFAEFAYLKPESGPLPREGGTNSSTAQTQQVTTTRPDSLPQPSLLERIINRLNPTPRQLRRAFTFSIETRLAGIKRLSPGLAGDLERLMQIPTWAFFVGGIGVLGYSFWQIGQQRSFAAMQSILSETVYGRMSLIAIFILAVVASLLILGSIDQSTYLMGLVSLQIILAAYVIDVIWRWKPSRIVTVCILFFLLTYAGTSAADRVARMTQHDDTLYSRYNVSIYRHIEAVTDFIAADWGGGKALTISYDILPEMRNLWWVAAWNTVDPTYRMGMNFDFLLTYHHGLDNTNWDAIGYVEDADYFIVYEPGLVRFDLEQYIVTQFGTIYVLKPR